MNTIFSFELSKSSKVQRAYIQCKSALNKNISTPARCQNTVFVLPFSPFLIPRAISIATPLLIQWYIRILILMDSIGFVHKIHKAKVAQTEEKQKQSVYKRTWAERMVQKCKNDIAAVYIAQLTLTLIKRTRMQSK